MSTSGLRPGVEISNDDLGSQIIISSWTLTAVSALFLFARLFGKLWTRRGLWVDDYILIVAWLAVLAPAVTSTIAVNEGLGKHVYNVPLGNAPHLAIMINSTVTVLILASALSKTSFVMTVLRLVSGYMRWAAWLILVTTNVFFGINIVLLWVTFDPSPTPTASPQPSTIALMNSLTAYGVFVTAYSAAMDFALVGMAWVVVSRLRMRSKREKIGVGLALSVGIIAGVTSIIKASIFPTIKNGDVTYTSASLHIWSIAEPSMTIIAASTPLLRIIFMHAKHLTTQRSGTHFGFANSDSGPSVGGLERKRTGSVSVQFVSMSSYPYGSPRGNMAGFDSSEENVMMLGNLQSAARAQTRESHVQSVEEKDEEEGVEIARPAVVFGLGDAYETRLARSYVAGSEPGLAS